MKAQIRERKIDILNAKTHIFFSFLDLQRNFHEKAYLSNLKIKEKRGKNQIEEFFLDKNQQPWETC